MARAWEGVLPKISLFVAVLITLAMLGIALTSARRDAVDLTHVAPATAGMLAWGSGVLFAFAGAARVFERDRADGIRGLLDARGRGVMAYVGSRAGGLAVLLAAPIAIGSVLTGLAAAAAATTWPRTIAALEGTLGALLYAIAFAAVLAPVSLAALGARSRAGGYGVLFFVLVLPSALAPLTAKIVPSGWEELVSIPGAVDAFRDGVLPPFDPLGSLRALIALALVVGLAVAIVRAQLARSEAEHPRGAR